MDVAYKFVSANDERVQVRCQAAIVDVTKRTSTI